MSNPGNIIGGHKATLHNPNVSEEAKQHSREVLKNEFGVSENSGQGGDVGATAQVDEGKNPGNVAGGLKAAIHNPNVSDEAKKSAEERLSDMK